MPYSRSFDLCNVSWWRKYSIPRLTENVLCYSAKLRLEGHIKMFLCDAIISVKGCATTKVIYVMDILTFHFYIHNALA